MENLPYILIWGGWALYIAFLILPLTVSTGCLGIESRGILLVLFSLAGFGGDAKTKFLSALSLLLNLSILFSPFLILSDSLIWSARVYFVCQSIIAGFFTIYLLKTEQASDFYPSFYFGFLSVLFVTLGINIL